MIIPFNLAQHVLKLLFFTNQWIFEYRKLISDHSRNPTMEATSELLPVNPQVMEPSLEKPKHQQLWIKEQEKIHQWPKAVWTFQPNPEDPVDNTTSNPETWGALDRLIYQNNTMRDQIQKLQAETLQIMNKNHSDCKYLENRIRANETVSLAQKAEINALETQISILEKEIKKVDIARQSQRIEVNTLETRISLLEKGDRPFTEFGCLFDRVSTLEKFVPADLLCMIGLTPWDTTTLKRIDDLEELTSDLEVEQKKLQKRTAIIEAISQEQSKDIVMQKRGAHKTCHECGHAFIPALQNVKCPHLHWQSLEHSLDDPD